MNTTPHDDNATTWHDLADQLTPDQRDSLAGLDARYTANGIGHLQETIESQLQFARDYIERNHIDATFADVPVPAGAKIETGPHGGWAKDLQTGGYDRSLLWRNIEVTPRVDVSIDGRQSTDGSFTRHISLWAGDATEITAEDARALAAALVEAADEMDRLQ